MFLGSASAAVQHSGAGRRGRSCQQADGQVCRQVSTSAAFPVNRGQGEQWWERSRPNAFDPFSHILVREIVNFSSQQKQCVFLGVFLMGMFLLGLHRTEDHSRQAYLKVILSFIIKRS